MSLYTLLKTAADEIDAMADAAETSQKRAEEAEAAAEAAKAEAADGTEKTEKAEVKTAAEKVEIGRLAKQAAADLQKAGLISTNEQADVFASQAMDHGTALQKLSQFAGCVPAQKLGKVVVDESVSADETPTADEAWTKKANAALERLGLS